MAGTKVPPSHESLHHGEGTSVALRLEEGRGSWTPDPSQPNLKTQKCMRMRTLIRLKQGAHIHQPTAWPVPHACAQPYHSGSGSHGQLFRPFAHQHCIAVGSLNGENPRVSKTVFTAEASASTTLSDSSTLRIRYLLLKQPPKNFQTWFHWGSSVELICITGPRSCKIWNAISGGRRSSPDAKTVAR